ncbi:MAG: sulfatase-like hydrolase/transferase, partial [Myxococcota bacterium]
MRSALAVLLCGTLVTVACGNEEPAGVAVPRHIVMITIDTLRADRLGSYGYDRELTPHLDRLADEGARFAQATAPITCTAPSHATLFTGQHPLAHGLTDNFHKLPGSVETLAETLSKRGFQTAAFFHQFQFSAAGVTQGFDTLTRDKTNDASGIVPAVRAWLQRADPAKRKFLWVHFFLPHAPSVRTPAGPCGRSFRTVSECAQLVRFGDRWIEHPYEGPLGQDFRTLEAIRKGDLKPPPEYFENFRDGYDS